jgi:hypothetical protein
MGSVESWYRATGQDALAIVGFDTYVTNNPFEYGVAAYGYRMGVYGNAGSLGPGAPRAGVVGTSRDEAGVRGTSLNSFGVHGVSGDPTRIPDLRAGVFGGSESWPGVVGYSRVGDGVEGVSFTGTGVRAVSFYGPGLYSISGTNAGVIGVSREEATYNNPYASMPAGVRGTSHAYPGVIGISNEVGVIGFSSRGWGIFGHTNDPSGYAGIFQDNVFVEGTLTAFVKNGVVAFPDGSKRLLHCMESPEHWFEDFGTGKLKGGRAMVRLDTDFAKVVKLDDYHVLATPEGDCNGLYVRRKSAKGFEVRELGAGKSNVAFAYRIVARRKDIKAHRRFAKIDTRPPLSAAVARPMRKPKRAAALRAFIARLEKESRRRGPRGAKKGGRSGTVQTRSRRRIARSRRAPRTE